MSNVIDFFNSRMFKYTGRSEEGRKSDRAHDRAKHPQQDGDLLYDPGTGALFIHWPTADRDLASNWEADYVIDENGNGHAVQVLPSWEIRERLVLIGNLFGWGEP